MAEEIQNASTIVPYSLIAGITLNGFLGFGMLLAVLFCLGDLDAAEKSSTGYPFMEIFIQATRSAAGSSVMITIITVLQICATVAFLAGSSRMTWSFARDHGLPGWRTLSRVSQNRPWKRDFLSWSTARSQKSQHKGTSHAKFPDHFLTFTIGRPSHIHPHRLGSFHYHCSVPPWTHQHRLY